MSYQSVMSELSAERTRIYNELSKLDKVILILQELEGLQSERAVGQTQQDTITTPNTKHISTLTGLGENKEANGSSN